MARIVTMAATLAGAMLAMSAAGQAADSVTVGTGGSASDAPFYIALDRGYFKDENLDVKRRKAPPDHPFRCRPRRTRRNAECRGCA